MATSKSMRLAAQAIGRESIKVAAVSAGGKIFRDAGVSGDIKVTDELFSIYREIGSGKSPLRSFGNLTERLAKLIDELKIEFNLVNELIKIGDETLKSSSPDFLVSRGEYLYAKIFAAFTGYKFVDSAEIVKFDNDGNLNVGFSEFLIREKYRENDCFVTGGFYGSDPYGEIKLFPRGGGDVTGALLARSLRAETYENYTDVDGVLPAPPLIVKNIETNKRFLKPLKELSFRQMEILTDFSVNVLHPDVLALLSETDIPIRITNTFNKYSAGTIISESVAGSDEFFFAVEKIGTIEKIAKKKQERIKIYRMFSNKKRKSKDEGFAVYLSDCEESRKKAKIISGLFDTEIFASSEGIILTIDKLGLKPVIKALTEQ